MIDPSFLATVSLFDVVGVTGFCLYVMNYTLLTLHRLTSHSIAYFVINWLAAACVLFGLMAAFNLAAALIQLFWIVISTVAIVLRLRRGSASRPRRQFRF